ncbi:MAG: hypothetical protein ABSH56_00925 [Bryobacteraceae bacterium]|jgi:hypothetical protein
MIPPPVPNAGNVDAKLRVGDIETIGASGIPNFAQLFSGAERSLDLGPDPCHPASAGRRLNAQEPSGIDEAEQRITASLDRMARQIRNLRMGQRGLFAFVDVLAKVLLTCVPEPPRDIHEQAVASGKLRYDRFLKSVGISMVGDSQAAMAELAGRSLSGSRFSNHDLRTNLAGLLGNPLKNSPRAA